MVVLSTLDDFGIAPAYPELVGRRILLAGLSKSTGADIVRTFAEQRTRLVLQFVEDCEETQVIAEMAASTALDVRMFTCPQSSANEIVKTTRRAIAAYDGLDAVVTVATLPTALDLAASEADVEAAISDTLMAPCLTSRVVANRMRATWTKGHVVTILSSPRPPNRRMQLVAQMARATLASLTRREAQARADDDVRVNAVAPRNLGGADVGGDLGLSAEPDIASLALHLISRRGENLSGIMFEAGA
jgi:NAD(P)-dependent dehydrogenase (short-subunit alcohol dehydrogenase family)